MIICSQCKAENMEDSDFCMSCGTNLQHNAEMQSNEELRKLADSLNSKAVSGRRHGANPNKAIIDFFCKIGNGIKKVLKKIGKKRLIISSCVLVFLAVSTILIMNFVVPYAPHYFKAGDAMKAKDYVTAIEEYEKAEGFLDSKKKLKDAHYLYAEDMFAEGEYSVAAEHYSIAERADSEDKIIECGKGCMDLKRYELAVGIFDMVEDGVKVKGMRNYSEGMVLFEKSEYYDAKECFEEVVYYSDAKDMINACILMSGDNYFKEGKIGYAKSEYEKLPSGFSYGSVSVDDRLSLLNNSKEIIDAVGTWYPFECYIETRRVSAYGDYDAWYMNDPNVGKQYLSISCKLNSNNNSLDIEGTVKFYAFDDYYYTKEYNEAEIKTKSFTIYNVTSIPYSHDIDYYTTLTYSNGVFELNYSDTDVYGYSTGSYEKYTSNLSFSKN